MTDQFTIEEAAATARKHGLSISDAHALWRLAHTAEEAEELAASFAKGDDAVAIAARIDNPLGG
jgi:hypothetical protein